MTDSSTGDRGGGHMSQSIIRDEIKYVRGDDIAPTNQAKTVVETFAKDVASQFGFGIGNDVSELVRELGGRIRYEDIMESIEEESGSIVVHGQHDFDITLPHYTSALRDRFTIAHELGHFLLHSDLGATPIIAYRNGSGRIEWEANWFAAGLLMPAEEFRAECQLPDVSTAQLAAKFGVSLDAARIRQEA
ncbi:MAG: ImmA/IrrE family metallo-endopeptidase [Pirellulaceae bacterium]